MQIGSRGSEVRAVQWALLAKGHDLPRWGADGRLGMETWQTLADFARDQALAWSATNIEAGTGPVPQAVLDRVLAPEGESIPPAPPNPFVDIVSLRTAPPPKTKRDAQGNVVVRGPSTIDGITVHQTSCVFGVSARQIRDAGGNPTLALHRRFLNVACHVATLRDGTVLKTNEFATYVHHANGLNRTTLGIEVEGIYTGWTKRPKSPAPGKPLTPLTSTVIDAARRGLKFMVEDAAKLGMTIKWIYAHRQSSNMRRADPGEGIWQAVVLDYAIPVLGLRTRPGFTVGTGMPIPLAWDAAGTGRY